MIRSLLLNKWFLLSVVGSLLLSLFVAEMPKDFLVATVTVVGVLFGGAFTGTAIVVSLISEDGLRRIYERKKENYNNLIDTMRASLILLLFLLACVTVLSLIPSSGSITIALEQWQVMVPIWRVILFVLILFIGLSILSVNEVLQAVIGVARIRFELAGSKTQGERKVEGGQSGL
jgi:uncharacterized BrkB/YihY/UPF0761 family membrane protein